MSRYASNTKVSADRSLQEIKRTVERYGAESFGFAQDRGKAMVQFALADRLVRFMVQMPDRDDDEYTLTETGRDRSETAAYTAWEKACRQRWRALALVVKAKLEAVESGITDFDREFLAYLVLPDGSTVADNALPAVAEAYATGRVVTALIPERATA